MLLHLCWVLSPVCIGCAVFVVSSRLYAVSWLSNTFRSRTFLPCCFWLGNFYCSVAITVNALNWRCHSDGDREGKRGNSEFLNPGRRAMKFVFRIQNIFDLLVSFEELNISPVLLLLLKYTYPAVNVWNFNKFFDPHFSSFFISQNKNISFGIHYLHHLKILQYWWILPG